MANPGKYRLPNLSSLAGWLDLEKHQNLIPNGGNTLGGNTFIPDWREQVDSKQEKALPRDVVIEPASFNDDNFVYEAVKNGNLPIVVKLLEHGINVNMMNPTTGLNLLTVACLNRHHKIVEELLKLNVDVNVTTSSKNEVLNNHPSFLKSMSIYNNLSLSNNQGNNLMDVSCLHIAVFNFDRVTTKLLLDHGVQLSKIELFNLTCVAAKNRCKKIVRLFLNYGVRVTEVNLHGETLIHFFLYYDSHEPESNRYDTIEPVLREGAYVLLNIPGNTLVYQAVKLGYQRIAQMFLNYNPDVQYISPDGHTALHLAIKKGFNVELIRTLLTLGSPVNTSNSTGCTPLLDAMTFLSRDQARRLSRYWRCNIDAFYSDDHYKSHLSSAHHDDNVKIVTALLDRGANPNVADNHGETPLYVASKFMRNKGASIIKLLLDHGVDAVAANDRGWTPLLTACENKNFIAVKYLLEHGVDPDHTSWRYLTPLYIILRELPHRSNEFEMIRSIIQLLIKYGADVNNWNAGYKTPLYYAIQKIEFHSKGNTVNDELFLREYKIILKILVSQGIILKTAGLKVNNFGMIFDDYRNQYVSIDHVKYSAYDILQCDVASNYKDVKAIGVEDSSDEDSIDDIRELETKCKQEIESIKNESINVNDLTFYALLTGNIFVFGSPLVNSKIQQTLKLKIYEKMFPLYIDILRNRVRAAKVHYEERMLRKSAREYFELNIYQQLPAECIDMILDYLSIKEIKTIIEAVEPSHDSSVEMNDQILPQI